MQRFCLFVLEATIKDNMVYVITGTSLKYHPIDVIFLCVQQLEFAAGNYTQIDSKILWFYLIIIRCIMVVWEAAYSAKE